jgi:hypothetical protein
MGARRFSSRLSFRAPLTILVVYNKQTLLNAVTRT